MRSVTYSAKLVISLKHNIIFEKFLEILLGNNVTFSHRHIRWQSKNNSEVMWVYISDFLLKAVFHQKFLKMYCKNSTRLGFRWLMKSIQTIKLYKKVSAFVIPCVFIFLCFEAHSFLCFFYFLFKTGLDLVPLPKKS